MPHRLLPTLLMLTLLIQAFAPAWAAMPMLAVGVAEANEHAEAGMPCHGATKDAGQPQAAPMPAMDCCGDGADCGHCSAGCMATPGLPASAAVSAAVVADSRHAPSVLTLSASAPPHELLRPPIAPIC